MTPEDILIILKKIDTNYRQRKNESFNDFLQRIQADKIYVIQQAKGEWCKLPSEKEIDKKRKFKMDMYSPSGWLRYSDGFMDAINYIKEYLNAQEPE